MTATYETASSDEAPAFADGGDEPPPTAGPIMRLPLTSDELSAIAFGRSRRSSTISITKDCRAGVSNALMTP